MGPIHPIGLEGLRPDTGSFQWGKGLGTCSQVSKWPSKFKSPFEAFCFLSIKLPDGRVLLLAKATTEFSDSFSLLILITIVLITITVV